MSSPLALITDDPEGGFYVLDSREGWPIAWRSCPESAAEVAAHLNACYPVGIPAPALDSLVHEVRMTRIGGEPEKPLHLLERRVLRCMIPDGVSDRDELWKPP